MRVKEMSDIKTRKNIVTHKGIICPACHGTGIDPKTRLRCRVCNDTRYV